MFNMKLYLLAIVAFAYLAYVNTESCVQCHSKEDERCATDPMNIMSKTCVNATSLCYTRLEHGYTIRGCATDLPPATLMGCHDDECRICTYMEGCNRQIFPSHRKRCLQCSGDSMNSTCATEIYSTAKVCPIFNIREMCYIRNSQRVAKGSFQRGCLSSAHANKQCIKEGNCFVCDSSGCNYLLANDTHIPLARDGAVSVLVSMGLLMASGVASLML